MTENIYNKEFFKLDRKDQIAAVEALIFASSEPLTEKTIYELLVSDFSDSDKYSKQKSFQEEIRESLEYGINQVREIVAEINIQLEQNGRVFRIVEFGGGYQFATKEEYGKLIQNMVKSKTKRRLSRAALETLAVIAYKQPISKPEIEKVRGINSNEVVNSLLEKKLVKISGRSEELGKPLLYGTTDEFLIQFGLRNIEELPKLKELDELMENKESDIIDRTDYIIENQSNKEQLENSSKELENGIENGIEKILNNGNSNGKQNNGYSK